jgi:energy-coupling factor transporter ATP-binding protein EcfA2
MMTFAKPQASKAALKAALYGPAGSGKTFTALLIAEGLAHHTGKRVAFVDTEHGSNFYTQHVEQRRVHPAAFDIDVLYSRSITETLAAVRGLDLATHGVLVIDSISHLWDAAMAAFTGKKTKAGTIPLHAWGAIKKPYKELLHLLLASPVHLLICGRQGIDYGEDEESGELKSLGFKLRAEGETAYEPDLLIRLEAHRPNKKALAIPTAHVEKDRTGVLAGQAIAWPCFDNIAKPLLGLLGATQAALPTEEEVGIQDAEALARQEREQTQRSAELAGQFTTRMTQASTVADLQRVGAELTPAVKQRFVAKDLERVRTTYSQRLAKLRPSQDSKQAVGDAVGQPEPARNGS